MSIKGNYRLMYFVEILSGFITYYACLKLGLMGVVVGFIPFLLALIMVQKGYNPDEREMSLMHKTNSYESIFVGIAMAVIYLFFPQINWFFALVSIIAIAKGIIGMLIFTLN